MTSPSAPDEKAKRSKTASATGYIVSLLLALLLLGHASWAMYSTFRAPDFMLVNATVTDAGIEGPEKRKSAYWHYQYEVNGQPYEDSATEYGRFRERLQAYPVGSTMPIYVDPRHPSQTRLDNERSWSSLFFYLFEWLTGAGLLAGWALLLYNRLFPTLSSLDALPHPPERVRKVNVRGQDLTALPESLAQFRNVRSLDASHNALTNLPKSFRQLEALQHLDLRFNQLREVPDVLFDLPNLKFLNVQNNPLTADAVAALSRLKAHVLHTGPHTFTTYHDWESAHREPHLVETLHLADKQLTMLPAEIGEMVYLQALYLQNNQLTDLPKELHQLKRLRVLNISHNAFKHLPEPVFALTELETLDAGYNQICTFRFPSSPLKALKRLSLAGNPLETLDLPTACPLEEIDLTETSYPEFDRTLLQQRFKQATITVSLNEADQAIDNHRLVKEAVQARELALNAERDALDCQMEEERQRAIAKIQEETAAAIEKAQREQDELMARLAAEQAAAEAAYAEAVKNGKAPPPGSAEEAALVAELEQQAQALAQAMNDEKSIK